VSHAAAMTAKLAAAGRAVESRRPDRLFDDPLAGALAGDEGLRWLEQWRLPGMPVENPTIGPRTRFFDDLVVAAVADGVRQVVLVAGGMDTRAFRLALPADTVTFELDQPAVLAEKQEVFGPGAGGTHRSAGDGSGRPPGRVVAGGPGCRRVRPIRRDGVHRRMPVLLPDRGGQRPAARSPGRSLCSRQSSGYRHAQPRLSGQPGGGAVAGAASVPGHPVAVRDERPCDVPGRPRLARRGPRLRRRRTSLRPLATIGRHRGRGRPCGDGQP
jgi:hypothetical protein